jgi:cell wall-associated NlpC family hydrolase
MRLTRCLLWLAPLLGLLGLFGVAALSAYTQLSTAPAPNSTCVPTVELAADTASPTGAQLSTLDAEQRGTIGTIIAIGRQRGLPPRAWQIAIQAGMTESRLRNLDHGDRDSLGIFQMRPSQGWGTPTQLQDPVYQINKFYDVLLDLPDWDTIRPGDAAQMVENSAFPQRYHQWETLAVAALNSAGVPDPSGCAPDGAPAPASEVAARAIGWALDQQGAAYVWGATGPDAYDCSGLVLRAYETAGVSLPRTSQEQWHAGTKVPFAQAQPGDLLFWAYDTTRPDETIHHVAIYLGGNQIVEAQQPGVPVHTRTISPGEAELMPLAVRPLASPGATP